MVNKDAYFTTVKYTIAGNVLVNVR